MPFRDNYTNEPVRTFATIEEFEQDQASRYSESDAARQQPLHSDAEGRSVQDDLWRLDTARKRLDLRTRFGFDLTEDGGIPKDRNGQSRMFIRKKDASGVERLMEFDGHELSDGTKLEMNSFEFFNQVQMGNVLVYPLGDFDPVQLQMKHRNSDMEFSVSRPLKDADMEKLLGGQPPEPKQPTGFFRNLMHRWFGFFQDDFDRYDREVKAKEAWEKSKSELTTELWTKNNKRKLGRVREEIDDAKAFKEAEAKAKQREAEEFEKQQLVSELDSAKRFVDKTAFGQKLSEAVYEPEPRIISTGITEKLFPGKTVKKDGVHELLFQEAWTDEEGAHHDENGYYHVSDEHNAFGDLTQITKDQLDLDSIKVGPNGVRVTKSDFCSLAMYAGMDPAISSKMYKYSPQYDPTLKQSLRNVTEPKEVEEGGKKVTREQQVFSDETIDKLIGGSCSSMYTTDTRSTSPRDQSGAFIKEGIDEARKATRDALNEYKAGKPEKLAKLLAVGIREQAGNIRQMESSMGEENLGGINASASLIKMLNADPKLKDEALKAGMKEKDLWTVEGSLQLVTLHQEAAKAREKILQAAVDGRELKPAEKAEAVKAIVKANVAISGMLQENTNAPSAMIDRYGNGFLHNGDFPKRDPKTQQFVYEDEKGDPIMPEKGKVYVTSGSQMYESMKRYYREPPVSVMLLKTPTGQKNLDTVADAIIAEDQLLTMSTKDMADKLPFKSAMTPYGQRGLAKMSEMGMLNMNNVDELRQEMKTGVAAPKKKEPVVEEPKKEAAAAQAGGNGNNIKNRAKMFENNGPQHGV